MADRPNLEKYKTAIHSTAKAIARSSFGEKKKNLIKFLNQKFFQLKIMKKFSKQEFYQTAKL